MSKKDLLERLTRAPSDPLRPRREEEGPTRAPTEPAVQTRVGTRVVRRRRVDSPEESAAAPGVATPRRRAAVVPPDRTEAPRVEAEEAAPPRVEAPPPPRPEPIGTTDASRPAAARSETPAPVETQAASAAEAPAEPARPKGRARKGAKTAPPPEPAADTPAPEVEPVRAAEPAPEPIRTTDASRPAAARPEKAARPPAEPTPPARPEPVRPEPARAAAIETPPPRERVEPVRATEVPRPEAARDVGDGGEAGPDGPRYAGLGKAVVMPPPGYDPTNPLAFRRKQEAERSLAGDGRRPTNRRRVEPGGTGDRADFRAPTPPGAPPRRRRGSTAAPPQRMDRPVRSKRKRVAGQKVASPAPKAQKRKIKVDNVISVGQLAHELGVKAPVVIRQLMDLGMMASITQMLDIETAALVASEFEYEVENVGFQEDAYLGKPEEKVEEENLIRRPPVVTIMGHVDHGKTTLLDAIRKSRVAAGEAGGITQHIGAYQVDTDHGTLTFIDTPGHEAFTAMRARGAEVTDIVVLVVAADDGVQPQTLEAINHAKAAEVPIVVAVNKMDKPGATMEPIMTRLAEQGLSPEAWGGDTMYSGVSALKGDGLDELLEAVLLQAEVLDLKANPDRFAEGVVLEAKMERGRGAVATVLVQKGTLNRGDHVVLGSAFGKVRAIVDHVGNNLKAAPPSTPVELFGLSELPEVGDSVNAVESEQNARALAEHRAQQKREVAMAATRRRTQQDIFDQAAAADRVVFHMILKADVGGSLQAIKTAIDAIQVPGAECRMLHYAVGDVNESDVNLAAANNATIVGFNVRLDARARQAASDKGVEPEFYTVIYDVLDRVQRGLKGLLAPVFEQVRQGTVEVRQLFRISKVGVVAGSYVLDGKIARNHTARVIRGGEQVWEGRVLGLKRFKEDVREVGVGYECGVSLDGFTDLKEGDVIEAYSSEQVAVG